MLEEDDIEELDEQPEEELGDVVPHEPVTVKLTYPITYGSRTIESLTFRPMTAKDMRRCRATTRQGMLFELASFLSGETSQVIDLLQGCDAVAVMGEIGVFFGPSHATGTKQ